MQELLEACCGSASSDLPCSSQQPRGILLLSFCGSPGHLKGCPSMSEVLSLQCSAPWQWQRPKICPAMHVEVSVCTFGSRTPHFCKELRQSMWSLTWGMQHRESRGSHCHSEVVILVYAVLVTPAGNFSCYCMRSTTPWLDCRSVQRSSEHAGCW